MTVGVYSYLILESEIELTRKANYSTEARIRVITDQFDRVYASIDDDEIMEKFLEDHEAGLNSIREEYEYVLEVDEEHLNLDEDIDQKRNDLEKRLGQLHRKILLFARVNGILTQDTVKEFFGKYRGSMNPSTVVPGGGDLDRRYQ